MLFLSSCSILTSNKYLGTWESTNPVSSFHSNNSKVYLSLYEDKTYIIEYVSITNWGGDSSELIENENGRYYISAGNIKLEYFISDNSYEHEYEINDTEIFTNTYYSDGTLNEKIVHYNKVELDAIESDYLGEWILDEEVNDSTLVLRIKNDYGSITFTDNFSFYFADNSEESYESFLTPNKLYLLGVNIEYSSYRSYFNLRAIINSNDILELSVEKDDSISSETIIIYYNREQ
jgi:hypothetical protein